MEHSHSSPDTNLTHGLEMLILLIAVRARAWGQGSPPRVFLALAGSKGEISTRLLVRGERVLMDGRV
jgi:hypothetical protein